MITRTPALLAIVGITVFVVACHRDAPEEVESETVVPVTVMPAETGSITAEAHATGLVAPAPGAELLVVAPEPARIVEIPKAEGDTVKRGDVLVRFEIPSTAAEAVFSAAVQAMVNSVQHAGKGANVSRWLAVREFTPVGLEVEVGDTGTGFAPDEVPNERLGVRVSIVERVANAGGTAEVDSQPGEGTVVTIRWPSSRGEL